jgi:hypothetical protein
MPRGVFSYDFHAKSLFFLMLGMPSTKHDAAMPTEA